MKTHVDLTGQKFEKLSVLNKIKTRKGYYYLCLCDCGKETTVRGSHLKCGITRSCGCLRPKLDYGISAFNQLVNQYKQGARQKKIIFELTTEQFKILINSKCYYCGVLPHKEYPTLGTRSNKKVVLNGYILYNGIDRKNNTIGYTLENSVSCCEKCNYSKGSLTDIEFIELISNIYNNLLKKD